MDYGSPELVITMLKAMAIGLAAGYLIWGYGRNRITIETPGDPAEPGAEKPGPDAPPPPAPGNLYAERPAEVDDLRQIRGIGPKMEALLNEKGIYQYRQIAAFTAEDLAWLDAAVESFPGRAERDGWVEQARALAEAKGSPPG